MKHYIKINVVISLFLFSIGFLTFAENRKIDSLAALITNAKLPDTSIVLVYNEIADNYKFENADSANYYYQKAFSLAQTSNYYVGKIQSLRGMANFQAIQGDYNLAEKLYQYSIQIAEENDDKNAVALGYNGLGIVYFYTGMHDKAIQSFFNALEIHEKLNNKREIATNLNSIGNVYYYQNNFLKALEYYQKSKLIIEQLDDLQGLSSCLNNIGLIKIDLRAYDEAIALFKQSLKIDESLGDKRGKSTSLANIGLALLKQGMSETNDNVAKEKYLAALPYFIQSLALDIEIGDKEGQANVYGNLSELQFRLGNYSKAIEYGQKGLSIANEIEILPTQKDINKALALSYEGQKRFDKALQHYKMYKLLSDSLFNLDNSQMMKEIETKYQSEKQQILIDNLTKERALKNAEIQHNEKKIELQRLILILVLICLLVVVISSLMLFRLYKQKKIANNVLTQRNEEINQMNEEILTQRDHLQLLNTELSQKNEEISAQRDEIEVQRDEIEKQNDILLKANKTIELRNKNIMDSMRYALHIQSTILPDLQQYTHVFKDCFLLFLPKDIVSGDFYWFARKGECLFFAVVDCTGHGIPGAFMSFLAHHILDAALKEQNLDKPSEILDYVNKEIFNTFSRTGDEKEVREGMDLVLCSYHINNKVLQWASARNSLFIKSNEKIIEFKGDKLAIGRNYHYNYKPYNNFEYQLKVDDTLYLTTDGLLDQFDISGQKKFSKDRFLKIIHRSSSASLMQQKQDLENELNTWRGNYEQLDDILVFAAKIF